MITLLDIAKLTEVSVPAVSNWKRRYHDFPEPEHRNRQELYTVQQIAHWLDNRKIPSDSLKDDELVGTTYGARFRKNAKLPTTSLTLVLEPAIQSLFNSVDKLRGSTEISTHIDLVFALLYLWARHPDKWTELTTSNPRDINYLVDRILLSVSQISPRIQDSVSRKLAVSADGEQTLNLMDVIQRSFGSVEKIKGVEKAEIAARVFDELIAKYAAVEGRRGLEFFTPPSVVRLAVELVGPRPGDRVLDPCCESGGFLVAAAEYMLRSGYQAFDISLSGQSATERTRWLAALNLDLHNIPAQLSPIPGVAVREKTHANAAYDVILSNPPFNMHLNDADFLDRNHWPYAAPPATNANFAWLQYAISSLTTSGRASILMANSALSSEHSRERSIRRAMVEDGVVEAIITLPPRLFVSTGIPVTLWRLRYPIGKPVDRILFIDARSFGKMINRIQRILTQEDIDLIIGTYHKWLARHVDHDYRDQPGFAASVAIDDIRSNDYRLIPGLYVGAALSNEATAAEALARSVARIGELQCELELLHIRAAKADALAHRLLEGGPLWNHS
jgi:type I restriction enzyme M protein